MPLTPAGCIAGPLDVLRTMLANSAAFQEWVAETEGLDWPADAEEQVTTTLGYIKLVTEPEGAGYVSPTALIELPLNPEYESLAVTGDGIDFDGGAGMLDLTLLRTIPEDLRDDPAEAWVEFSGYEDVDGIHGVSGIINDLRGLSAQGEYLYITRIAVQAGPGFVDDYEVAERFTMACQIRMNWGVSA